MSDKNPVATGFGIGIGILVAFIVVPVLVLVLVLACAGIVTLGGIGASVPVEHERPAGYTEPEPEPEPEPPPEKEPRLRIPPRPTERYQRREWTIADQEPFDASLVAFDGSTVYFRQEPSGGMLQVPIKGLIPDDQWKVLYERREFSLPDRPPE